MSCHCFLLSLHITFNALRNKLACVKTNLCHISYKQSFPSDLPFSLHLELKKTKKTKQNSVSPCERAVSIETITVLCPAASTPVVIENVRIHYYCGTNTYFIKLISCVHRRQQNRASTNHLSHYMTSNAAAISY